MIKFLIDFYRTYKTFLIFIILIIFSLTLLTLNSTKKIETPRVFSLFIFSKIHSLIEPLHSYYTYKASKEQLIDQTLEVMDQLNKLRNLENELEELRSQLNFKQANPVKVIPARVVYKSASLTYNYFIIDSGEKDGFFPDMPVFTPKGVIGIVEKTEENFSIVKTIKNLDFKLSVQDTQNVQGILKWDGFNFKVNNVPKSKNIQIGDLFYTSSVSTFFPKGVPVGKVTNLAFGNVTAFFDITITPTEDLDNVINVFGLSIDRKLREYQLKFFQE